MINLSLVTDALSQPAARLCPALTPYVLWKAALLLKCSTDPCSLSLRVLLTSVLITGHLLHVLFSCFYMFTQQTLTETYYLP